MQATDEHESQTLTVAQAAARLGISRENAYRLIRQGTFPLPILRIGGLLKVSRAQLDEYLSPSAPVSKRRRRATARRKTG